MKRIALIIAAWLAASTGYADICYLSGPITGGLPVTPSVHESDGPHLLGLFEWSEAVAMREMRERIRNTVAQTQFIRLKDDGTKEVLVGAGVIDWSNGYDGQTLYVTVMDMSAQKPDVWRLNVETKEMARITRGRYWNMQGVECPDGTIAFLSDRDGWRSPAENYKTFNIWKCNADGTDEHRIGHMNLGGAMGLHCGPDGRLYYASGEQQGGERTGTGGNWGIFSMNPDGGHFNPEVSAYYTGVRDVPCDFPAVEPDGSLLFEQYYDTRIRGLVRRSPNLEGAPGGSPGKFDSPLWQHNPSMGPRDSKAGWQRKGTYTIAEWSDANDSESIYAGENVGKLSHAHPYREGGILVTWSGDKGDYLANLGVYCIRGISKHPSDMQKIVDEPNRHEWFAKYFGPYRDLFGKDRPDSPTTKRDAKLPLGTPFGVVGTSSISWRELITNKENAVDNKMVEFADEDVAAVRFLSQLPALHGGTYPQHTNGYWDGNYGRDSWRGWLSPANEIHGILGEVPVKHWRTLDGKLYHGSNPPTGATRITRVDDGKPDTSFAVEIPANQSWTVQLLNDKGEALFTANTWHQVIPGENRTDCQGCHAHHKPDPLPFDQTLAAAPEYVRQRFTKSTLVDYDSIKHLIPGAPRKPWRPDWDRATQRFIPPWAVAFKSAAGLWDEGYVWQVDENNQNGQWVKKHNWTAEGIAAYRKWQDTAFPASLDAGTTAIREDSMSPTVNIEYDAEHVYVGALDPHSGLAYVMVNGVKVTLDSEHRWIGPRTDVEVLATDNQGNSTPRTVKAPGGVVEPPDEPEPEPTDPCDELRQQIAELEAEIARLVAAGEAVEAERDELRALSAELEAKLAAGRKEAGETVEALK